MAMNPDVRLDDPNAVLEMRLIDDYIRSTKHDPAAVRAGKDEGSKQLLADASRHASGQLAVIQARSRYVQNVHGATSK